MCESRGCFSFLMARLLVSEGERVFAVRYWEQLWDIVERCRESELLEGAFVPAFVCSGGIVLRLSKFYGLFVYLL